MLNISDAERALWNESAAHKAVIIDFPNKNVTFTNSDIVADSVSLTEAICEDEYLTFEGCIASQFSVEVAGNVQDLRGEYMEVSIAIDQEDPIPLFVGYVDSQTNQSAQDMITELTAYDPLVTKINPIDVTSWYNGLTFPITVKAFRDSFFQYIGFTQETTTLVNDSLSLSKSITDEVITGESIIKWICNLNACFGQIDRTGVFVYRYLGAITKGLYPAVDLYPATDLYPSAENFSEAVGSSIYRRLNYEPFETEKITKVNIYNQSGALGGTAGSGTNIFNISDNPLAWGVNMASAAAAILAKIDQVAFIPAEIDAVGLPYLECGDIIAGDTKLNRIRTYILSRTLEGIQALEDTFRSPSEKLMPAYSQSLQTSVSSNTKGVQDNADDITQLGTIVATKATIQDLNATNARVGDLEADHVSVQDLNAVDAKIDNLTAIAITTQNFTSQKITSGMVNAGVISANKITTGTLSADRIDVDALAASSFTSKTVKVGSIMLMSASTNILLTGQYVTVLDVNGNSVTVPRCV